MNVLNNPEIMDEGGVFGFGFGVKAWSRAQANLAVAIMDSDIGCSGDSMGDS